MCVFTDQFIAELFDMLEFAGMPPRAMRARCSRFRYCPNPLGIVTAVVLDKLEFIELINADFLFLHKPHTPNYRKGS